MLILTPGVASIVTPIPTEAIIVTINTKRVVLDSHINIKMSTELRDAFKRACYIDRVEMSEVIRSFITKFNNKKREKA